MASVRPREWTSPDGTLNRKWEVRYKDPTGSYRGRMFARKKEADAYRRQVENELASGDHIAPAQSNTIAAATVLFLEEVDNKVAIGAFRPCTGRNYHAAFRRHVLPLIGDRLMLDVDAADIERWYYQVVRSKLMTPVFAYRRLWFIKALFDFAIRRKWVRKGVNPAAEAMAAIGKPAEAKIDTFDLATVRRVIEVASERTYRRHQRQHEMTQIAVHLAAFCGLRWGEIFGLTLSNIDLANRVVRIRHSLDGLGNLQEPKTAAGNRDVPLPGHIAEQLTAFIAAWIVPNDRGIVFCTDNGTPMKATNFHATAWRPLLRRAGVVATRGPWLRFHALRHFAVSWMIENGWPITDVSTMIGHANVAITLQVYAHVIKGRNQTAEAMQQLAERLLAEAAPRRVIALPNHTGVTHGNAALELSMA
ncbi:MAG: tyrosine-type recombinase/integrase [Sphingomonadaceae bacterium]|nr:tyrosine-type recombinase/integrase [Sphingomonadaceae bacterium]